MKDEDQNGNFSNDRTDTFEEKKRYIGVRLQQGVPLLDRDWNELEDIRRYEEMITRKHYIGDGTPDDGFKISACSPETNDFLIGKGHCMVDGYQVVNEPTNGESSINYYKQDGVSLLVTPTQDRKDIVYLDVWIEEVNDATDTRLSNPNDLKEQTTVRHKINWLVKVGEGVEPKQDPLRFHHLYYLARIERKNGQGQIQADDIKDLREIRGKQISWKPADIGKNDWENVNGYNPAGYFRDMNGFVHLRGGIKYKNTLEDKMLIFELENNYKPANTEIRIVAGLNETGKKGYHSVCEIAADGKVSCVVGDSFDWLFLDGITFIAAPSKSDPQ